MQSSSSGRSNRRIPSTYVFSLFFFCFTCLCFHCSASILDKSALLKLKSSLSDPYGVLSSWVATNSSDYLEHCSWNGVLCSGPNFRVSALKIKGKGQLLAGNDYKGEKEPCFDPVKFPLYGFGVRRVCSARHGRLIGKLPSVIADLTELRVLSLPFHGLNGLIPVEIWGLQNLEVLDLEGNSLTGILPPSFKGLSNLRVLNLGLNEIDGDIPSSLSKCVGLKVLNLAGNRFRGSIPGFIGSFPRLARLYLSYNSLEGEIPSELAHRCQKLEYLDLSGNKLDGGIPQSLGYCLNLRVLMLSSNRLRGVIPRVIGQLKKLQVLDVSRNSLSGPIPKELGYCTDLSVLVFSNLYQYLPGDHDTVERNRFGGTIATEITSLAKLRILWAPAASLKGEFPSNWGNCASLEMINLSQNFFTGRIGGALGSCKNVIYADLSSNKLTGQLGKELPVPCMVVFDVSGNLLSGSIPRFNKGVCRSLLSWISSPSHPYGPTFSYLSFFAHKARSGVPSSNAMHVFIHNFGRNNFSGDLHYLPVTTTSWVRRRIDYAFLADGNKLSGSVSWHLSDVCHELNGLYIKINENRFTGQIPLGMSSMCKSLKYLDASGNQISGVISQNVENIASVAFLDTNLILDNAHMPVDLGQLKHLHLFSIPTKRFRGSLAQLLHSDLIGRNSLSPSVKLLPDAVNLRKLTALMLHNVESSRLNHPRRFLSTNLLNCTSGSSLLSCHVVAHSSYSSYQSTPGELYTSSYQSSSGELYTSSPSISANESDNADDGGGNKFSSIEIASLVSASTIVAVLLALVGVCIYTRKYGQKGGSRVQVLEKEITVFSDIGAPLTFQGIVKATECFSTRNCIGNGGFGATYRAEISPGVIVAVKRLAVGRVHCVQQFHAEIKTLGTIQHGNLVTLIGYYASETDMFLIYNYLPGGNLEKFIHDRRTRPVSWRVLHSIALDVAYALAYLHDSCDPRVIHRDVKPSNILLDNNLKAYLSDFGLSRLLGNSETHATTGVEGTFGYLAPEYAMTCRVSEKADVYSYGVVLLELLSDKRALDPSFSAHGDGFNIVSWSCMLLKQGRAKEVFTAGLWDSGPRDDLVEVLHLAVKCTLDSLTVRPTMKQVVQRLRQLRPVS